MSWNAGKSATSKVPKGRLTGPATIKSPTLPHNGGTLPLKLPPPKSPGSCDQLLACEAKASSMLSVIRRGARTSSRRVGWPVDQLTINETK